MTKTGLYLHIPFCNKRKCVYCDFPSFAGCEDQMEAVTDKMCDELFQKAHVFPNRSIATLYVGGGTPSILPPKLFTKLMQTARKCFSFEPDAECSVEMNPGTVTNEFLDAAAACGINRVSLGVQSADEKLLRLLGRIHTFDDARKAVTMCRAHGIGNLNLDMMLGLPTQTVSDALNTLENFLSLDPTHMSVYGLIVEDGTKMAENLAKGIWTLPPEDEAADMYDLCRKTLEERGFARYEISNFAKPGYICRHNFDCWDRREYLGVGVSACGFIGDKRYQNPVTIDAYLAGEKPEITEITPEDARFEAVMLGLRTVRGVSRKDFEARYGMTLENAFPDKIAPLIGRGLIEQNDDLLRLTPRGMDIQNEVLVELMDS